MSNSPSEYDSLALPDRLLFDATDDWLNFSWIISCVQEYEEFDLRDAGIIAAGVVASLILDEYLFVGNLGDDGVIPWELSKKDSAVELLRRVATDEDQEATGATIWFDLTPKGEARTARWL